MDTSGTREATYVIRVWAEQGDRVIRGRIVDVATGDEVAARGIAQLLATVETKLRELEAGSN
ncbi:MAG: hypothetical protein OEU32_15640 [Acidimicrobiia bacterium]|nr:hypothetical protein [Acidimicrobiia bacterium]